MDPVLTTPEGRSRFGSRLTEGSPWTLFCLFWHQKWPGGVWVGGFLMASVAGTGQAGLALPSPWPNQDHCAAWSGEREAGVRWSLRCPPLWDSRIPWFGWMGWWHCAPPAHPPGSQAQAGLGLSRLGGKAAEAIHSPWNPRAEGTAEQPPLCSPNPPFLVLTGCKVLLVMYCTERVNWSVTVLYCMKTHELPCIVSNGLFHVSPLPVVPKGRMCSVGSPKLSGANSSLSDGAPADTNWPHARPQLEVHHVFLVCLYHPHTHTHTHKHEKN